MENDIAAILAENDDLFNKGERVARQWRVIENLCQEIVRLRNEKAEHGTN